MEFNRGLQRTGAVDVDALRLQFDAVFVLPATIGDRVSFFEAMRATFPLDPPVLGSDSWDALDDSLWEGLHHLEARRIAMVWPSAHVMEQQAPFDFRNALHVLERVARLLGDERDAQEISVLVELAAGAFR